MDSQPRYMVAVVGAGPAGIFAAKELVSRGVHVVLFNRDVKPGGLAEYGIYPEKYRMKNGLRSQFRQILNQPHLDYYGNVTIGEKADIRLDDLKNMGFQAILVTAGAQGTKWLGLPGENLVGVYHAKDLVYHYNQLPPYSQYHFQLGRRVAVVGAGNVMLDIVHYLSTLPQVEEVTALIRRGPAEVKFSKVELEYVGKLLDMAELEQDLTELTPLMQSLGQNPDEFRAFIQSGLEHATPAKFNTRFRLKFLVAPTRMLGDEKGRMTGIELDENTLVMEEGAAAAKTLGTRRVLPSDSIVFAIGDRVDDTFGLPVKGSEYLKSSEPRYPIESTSYEVLDPATRASLPGVFVAGWSRKASSGLVGVARKDGTNGAKAVLQYLQDCQSPLADLPLERVSAAIKTIQKPVVTQVNLARLEAVELQRANRLGIEEFKFSSNEEMFEAMGL